MSMKDDGGPAFPQVELDRVTGNVCDQHFGLSLRDYFAAKAMQSMLASAEADDFRESEWGQLSLPEIADQSYRMADYMLGQREVKS